VIVSSLRLEVDGGALAAPEVSDRKSAVTRTTLDPQLAVATFPRTPTLYQQLETSSNQSVGQ